MAGGTFYGADVAALRALGERFDRAADEIERAGRVLAQDITTTTAWQGPDAVGFRGAWGGSHHPRVTSATSALRAAARTVRLNADQQDRASAVDGGASFLGTAIAGAAGALSGILSGLFGDRNGGSIPRPPSGTSPDRANAWWRGLSEEQRDEVIAKHPEWIGNRDGIPAAARDKANRILIHEYRKDLEEERDELKSALSNNIFGGLFTNDDRKLEIIEGKLRGLDAIDGTLALGNRQLLVLDISATEQLKAAVAVGNVDTADHVAVFTPGFRTTVQDSLDDIDRDMAALRTLAVAESTKYGDGGSVATVAWLGYEAPQANEVFDMGGRSVANESLARAGSQDLAAFYRGINSSRDTDPHLTALGHSYGSTTTGMALQGETGVDDVLFFGSPGIGTSDISDIRVPEGHVYRIESPHDPIADLGRFGADPSRIDGMTGLSADDSEVDGRHLAESGGLLGHTEYLTGSTTSQHNLAVVVVGLPERAVWE